MLCCFAEFEGDKEQTQKTKAFELDAANWMSGMLAFVASVVPPCESVMSWLLSNVRYVCDALTVGCVETTTAQCTTGIGDHSCACTV